MSTATPLSKDVQTLLKQWGNPGLPTALFSRFGEICAERFGIRLCTILTWDVEKQEIQRVFSSDHDDYPLGGRKPMGLTAWGERLLKGSAEAIFCRNEDDIRWAFPDADLLIRMQCTSNLSAPVRWNGSVLGVASISDKEGSYSDTSLEEFDNLTQLLVPALLHSGALERP
jgi:hypothetical protein